MAMHRRTLVTTAAAFAASMRLGLASPQITQFHRVRPEDAAWPDANAWESLNRQTGGSLTKVHFPLAECVSDPASASCDKLFQDLRNPYFIGDEPGLTQTLGWVDAWTVKPSVFAVTAHTSAHVAAAVNFARERRLRLVVRGGGHSYLGTSNAPDSLLLLTRPMNAIELHDAFIPQGCTGAVAAQPGVSVGAGALWGAVYQAVTTKAGRYVQGGGCMTVGVAGLVQSGGFGSFSKAHGTAAAGLMEAEIVTADGMVRIANQRLNPDLFWAIKGGGGGSFGVVTRLTLRTHELPPFFGAVRAQIQANSDDAFRKLVDRIMGFYHEKLCNPNWGEQISFRGNTVTINMVFQGLDKAQAGEIWRPLFDWISTAPNDYTMASPLILAVPAQHFWDARLLKSVPGIVRADDRAGSPADNIFWAGDAGQVGQFLHGYQSAWLPRALLEPARRPELVEALVAAAGTWSVSLHFNKGLAGAAPEALAGSADTATNPAMLDAFALAIIAGEELPCYPGVPGHEPDLGNARRAATAINAAMLPIRRLLPAAASYVSESDYFQADWQKANWGNHYARLAAVKTHYDPDGLFVVHHGVGSEAWSADGFNKIA